MREDYVARINRVLDHIETHLGQPLKLGELATVAAFSPYHFHRIFAAMVGEAPGQFVQRLRLERAATMLRQNPKLTITEIALDASFGSSSTFARAFKEHFGVSASEYREGRDADRKIGKPKRKIGETVGNLGKAPEISVDYRLGGNPSPQAWRIEMKTQHGPLEANVEVQDLPDVHVAYLRHTGPYQGDGALFERLWGQMMQWAGPRELFRPGETQMITLYHDNPDVTAPDKQRLSICISVPADTEVEGEIGKLTVPGGKYAVARFELDPAQYGDAWNAVYGGWLPESGYQPDDRLPFERCPSDQDHSGETHVVEICVPVKPL